MFSPSHLLDLISSEHYYKNEKYERNRIVRNLKPVHWAHFARRWTLRYTHIPGTVTIIYNSLFIENLVYNENFTCLVTFITFTNMRNAVKVTSVIASHVSGNRYTANKTTLNGVCFQLEKQVFPHNNYHWTFIFASEEQDSV